MPSIYYDELKNDFETLDDFILAEAIAGTPVATHYFEDQLALAIDDYTTAYITSSPISGALASLNSVFNNGIIVPLYVYPSNIYTNNDYAQFIALKRAFPQVPMIAILNPSSGPGSSVDGNYTAAIQLLQGAGIKVFGYVATGYNSSRTLSAVKTDISTWLSFYPTINGLFFDEMTYVFNPSNEAFYSAIGAFAKQYVPYTIGNPGSPFDSQYIYNNIFDIIIGWESSTAPTTLQIQEATTNPSPPPTYEPIGTGAQSYSLFRRGILLHDQGSYSPSLVAEIKDYYGWIFITDGSGGNPYGVISSYLLDLFQAFDPATSALVPWSNITGTPTTAAGYGMSVTGTGPVVQQNSPSLVTPDIGAAIGISFNSLTGLSSTTPAMDGSAAVGTATTAARADHVHPTDTSRAPTASPTFTGTVTMPFSSSGFVKTNSSGVLSVDTNTYLTGNQTITLTGGVTGSGTTSITVTLSNTAVTGSILTGYVSGSGTISSTDSVLQAIQKLNGNISLLTGAVIYQGTWNASTNTPTLVSGVGTKGYYYKVSVAGTTTIDGISQWNVGDSIIFDGTTWDKIDGLASEVSSVFGRVGAVMGAAADYSGVAMTGITSLNGLIITANTGTITTGTWNGTAIGNSYIATALSGKTYEGITITTGTGTLTLNSFTLTVSGTASISGTNTGDQTISLTGDVTGIGTGSFSTTVTGIQGKGITLASGYLKYTGTAWSFDNSTFLTGNQTITLGGDLSGSGATSITATIGSGAVTLAKMAILTANSIIGNNTGSPAIPLALTGAQVTALLSNLVGDSGSGGTKGLAPAPASGDAAAGKYLDASGAWSVPPGSSGAPTGAILPYAGISAPAGFLLCDGSAVNRSTYSSLWGVLSSVVGTFTVTIASPAVVTLTAHGLSTGDNVELTTTGALPTGLSVNTNYFVIKIDANTFNLATSYANAIAGTKINTSGSQSGTHSLRYTPFGVSGSSNFLLPDLRGTSPKGVGTSSGYTQAETVALGTKYDDQFQGHWHGLNGGPRPSNNTGTGGTITEGASASNSWSVPQATNPIADTVPNGTPRTGNITRGKGLGVNHIIKT